MRKKELVESRNKKIVKRFHNLYDIKRMRIEDVLLQMENEFFLDKNYIYSLVFYNKDNNNYYNSLTEKKEKK